MLTLKELRFKGIGRFIEEQSVSFEQLGNLVQVDGQNNNTGGSSGAGKSTIFNALDFLLGINSTSNNILQSRITEESIWVEGIFDYDGLPLTITRGKKLKIDLNGEVTTGSSKLSEEKLDQILAIPRDLFKPMLHKEQGERGFFLNFTPKETNDFLTDCLGLTSFKKPMLALDEKLQECNTKKVAYEGLANAARARLEASRFSLSAIGEPPVKDVNQDIILKFKSSVDAATKELKALSDNHSKELVQLELKKPAKIHINFDKSAKIGLETKLQAFVSKRNFLALTQKDLENKAQAHIQSLKHKQSELSHQMDMGNSATSEAMRLAEKVKKLRDAKCHTCGQDWANESAKREEESLLENINKLKVLIAAGTKASAEYETAKKDLELAYETQPPAVSNEYQECLKEEVQLKQQIDENNKAEHAHNDSINTANFNNQANFNKEFQSLKDKHSSEQGHLRGQIDINTRMFESSVAKLRSYEDNRVRYETTISKLKEQEKEYTIQFDEAFQEVNKVINDIINYEELKKAIKSYLSCSFDEALETISENATRLARNVPNLANCTIQLTGTWETKDGKVKEEVNATISLDGDENVDIRSLCGGERSAIDLAVDLSVIELIENKTNKGINIFLLDEPFTGLDTVCIEMALEVLKNASLNKKLIIVDHNPEVKQMVENSVLVIRDGLTSRVIQN